MPFGKSYITLLVITLLLFSGNEIKAQGSTHDLVISNLGKRKGVLYIAWYNNETDFRKETKAVFTRAVPVEKQDQVTVAFDHILPGTYAIAILLDQDGNKKMTTNLLGIPKEKYGFSNNVYPAFRAANWKEASFELKTGEGPITIRLK